MRRPPSLMPKRILQRNVIHKTVTRTRGRTDMRKHSTEIFVGMDVSDKTVEVYALPKDAEAGKATKIENSRESIGKFAEMFSMTPGKVKIALETGTHTPWMSELLKAQGFEVVVADARKLRMIWQSDRKSDARDAEMLARILRADPKLLGSVAMKDAKRRHALAVVKARECIVAVRAKMINSVRGLLKSDGISTSSLEPYSFGTQALRLVPKELLPALKGMLAEIVRLGALIKDYDKKLERLNEEFDGCKQVRQIKGVGPVAATAFVLTVGDPNRFQNGARLASYLGLVPRRDQSGEVDKQLPITKAGSKMLRRYLVQSANYIMGPFADRECDLRKFGDRLSSRGGKNSKKKAKIAIARKLAVLMLKLWSSGAIYDPQHSSRKKAA